MEIHLLPLLTKLKNFLGLHQFLVLSFLSLQVMVGLWDYCWQCTENCTAIGKRTLVKKWFKDTQRENVPPNKTQALTKCWNMNIWVVGTIDQLFKRGSCNKVKLSKNTVVSGKTLFFVIGPFYTTHSIRHIISFWLGCFCMEIYVFKCSSFKWKTVLLFLKKGFRFLEN